MDLEVQEAIRKEVSECSLHATDGRVLSVELDEAHTRADRMNDEHATEAEQLSWWVIKISDVLVDLGMLPIQDIPQLSKLAQEVLPVVDLILERIKEVVASSASPWD
jgi:hypothetical protein